MPDGAPNGQAPPSYIYYICIFNHRGCALRLTVYADYSLRVLTYLGLRADRLCTIGEIADAYGISHNHLMKVVHQLGRFGFVETVRGRSGGLRLARAPEAIRGGDVVRRMEGDFEIVDCFAGGTAHGGGNGGSSGGESRPHGGCVIAPSCRLAGVLDEALHAFLAVLDRYTLADLLASPARLMRHFPGLAEASSAPAKSLHD